MVAVKTDNVIKYMRQAGGVAASVLENIQEVINQTLRKHKTYR